MISNQATEYTESEAHTDGKTVWVNNAVGAMGRFSQYMFEVFTPDDPKTKYRVFAPPEFVPLKKSHWELFKEMMKEHHGVDVSDELRPRQLEGD